MRVVHFNVVFEPAESGRALLARYDTLSTLAARQAAAGAEVMVLQRFDRDDNVSVDGVRYEFRRDNAWPAAGRAWMFAPRLTALARRLAPEVVHFHGVSFPVQARGLRAMLPSRTALALQDHGIKPWANSTLRSVRRALLAAADGILLNAIEMAEPLREAGVLPRSVGCFAVGESSSTFRAIARSEARARVGLAGDPLVLWVGRLQGIKDPITAVEGFCRAARTHTGATLAMIYQDADELSVLQDVIARHAVGDRVTFVGRVAHADLVPYLSAADVFLSAGRWEGSNYALIEAMACGLWPVCSNNPSHRGMLGDVGHLFDVGDASSCAQALEASWHATADERSTRGARVRARFDAALSWDAVVRQSLSAYETLLRTRSAR